MSKAGPGTESPQTACRTRPESPWRDPVIIALMDAPRAHRPMALLALLPAALLAACSGGPRSGAADRSGDAALSLDLYETDVRPPSSESYTLRVEDGVDTEEGTVRQIVT